MECKNCGKEISSTKKFCNNSCAATFNNKNRVRTTESKAKTSASLLKRQLPENEIIQKYESGLSTHVISKEYSCSRETISKILKRNNIPLRVKSLKNKSTNVNYVISNNTNKICEKHNCEYSPYSNGKYVCKACCVDRVSEHRRKLKLQAIEYKGGKCEYCGYNNSPSALEFHHTNPNEKDFSISSKGTIRNFDKIKPELDKCIMLCANCHREEHDKLNKNT